MNPLEINGPLPDFSRCGMAVKAILQKEYSRSVPLSAAKATALMEGWDRALAGIFTEASMDIQRSEIAQGH